jgi:hypothetical protein
VVTQPAFTWTWGRGCNLRCPEYKARVLIVKNGKLCQVMVVTCLYVWEDHKVLATGVKFTVQGIRVKPHLVTFEVQPFCT